MVILSRTVRHVQAKSWLFTGLSTVYTVETF
jgi:hypothetical protein